MNDSMKEYIHLKKQFQEQDKDSSSVLAFYEFADRLALLETPEAKQVLVGLVCQCLCYLLRASRQV